MTFVQEPKPEGSKTEPSPLVQSVADYPQAAAKKDSHPTDNAPAVKHHSWILWLIVLALVAGGGVWIAMHFLHRPAAGAAAKREVRPTPVVTATVRKGDFNLYLNEIGTVIAFQTVQVRSRVDGELMTVYFTEGQIVKENDPLVEIDPRPYQVQLEQAQGQLARDQASLQQAQLDLTRDKGLVAARAASPQQLDAQVSTVGQYQGAVKTDQAMINNAKLQIQYCHITAPISGRIGLRLIDKGNFIQASSTSPLVVITQLQPIAVRFPVPQNDVFRVQRKFNTGEDLVVEAWNQDLAAKLATGKLLAIDNQVDTTTGTVALKAVFQNEDNLLFPNEFVNAKLLIDTRHGAIIVPRAAIQNGPNGAFSFVVKADQEVEVRPVKVGPVEEDQAIIESGLSSGEVVVTDGTEKLQPKSKVEIRDPKPAAQGKPAQDGANGDQAKAGP